MHIGEHQSKKEWQQIKLFAEATSFFDIEKIEKTSPPEPDFNITINGKLIGIELTELHYEEDSMGFWRKKFTSESEKIVELAQMKFEKLSLSQDLRVTVSFTDKSGTINNRESLILSKSDREELSNSIVDIVSRNIPEEGKIIYAEEFYFDKWNEWPEKLSGVWITNITGKFKSFWSASFAGSVAEISKEVIVEALDKKKDKPKNYKNNYSEIWLLMTCNKGAYSSNFSWENIELLKKESFTTLYNRLFVFDLWDNSIVELNAVKNEN